MRGALALARCASARRATLHARNRQLAEAESALGCCFANWPRARARLRRARDGDPGCEGVALSGGDDDDAADAAAASAARLYAALSIWRAAYPADAAPLARETARAACMALAASAAAPGGAAHGAGDSRSVLRRLGARDARAAARVLRAHYGDDAGAGAAPRLGEQLERAAAAAVAAAAAEIDSDDEAEDERGAEEPVDDADSDDEVPAASRAEAAAEAARAEFVSRVAELRLTLGLAPLELAGF